MGVLLPKYVARRLTQFLANPHPRQREGWWVCWCQRRDYLPLGRTPLLFTTDAAAYQPLTNYSESMQYAGLFLTAGHHCYLPLNCIALIPLFCPPCNEKGKYEIQRHGNSLISLPIAAIDCHILVSSVLGLILVLKIDVGFLHWRKFYHPNF